MDILNTTGQREKKRELKMEICLWTCDVDRRMHNGNVKMRTAKWKKKKVCITNEGGVGTGPKEGKLWETWTKKERKKRKWE